MSDDRGGKEMRRRPRHGRGGPGTADRPARPPVPAQDRGIDGLDDRELLARHVDGDPEAFGEIVRRHRDRLWAVALRTLGDREEAADAVQDALISAYRAAHTFRGQSAVTTWLHRITVNACLDRARKAVLPPHLAHRRHRAPGPAPGTARVRRRARRAPGSPPAARRRALPAARRAARRARARGHAGLSRRRGRRGPRSRRRHGEEPLRPRPRPAAAPRLPLAPVR